MDEEIRAPDMPIRECLLPHNSYPTIPYESEEDQLRQALEESQSMFEFEEQERLENLMRESKSFAEQEPDFELQHAIILSRSVQKEREERTKHVASFKSKFTQFIQIDKSNKEFYSDMIRYVEKYESGDLTSVSIGDEYYIRFRRTLDNMRISPVEKAKILEIIIQ